MEVIELLIGHPGFMDNLHYAPVQQRNPDEDGNKVRVYNNVHTTGWWETQKKSTILEREQVIDFPKEHQWVT